MTTTYTVTGISFTTAIVVVTTEKRSFWLCVNEKGPVEINDWSRSSAVPTPRRSTAGASSVSPPSPTSRWPSVPVSRPRPKRPGAAQPRTWEEARSRCDAAHAAAVVAGRAW